MDTTELSTNWSTVNMSPLSIKMKVIQLIVTVEAERGGSMLSE